MESFVPSAVSRMVKARCLLIMNNTAALDMIGAWMGSCGALYSK